MIVDDFDAKKLESIVGCNVLIAIATALTATPLQKLPDVVQLNSVADEILQLFSSKTRILAYIQSQMEKIAPNLNNLLGGAVAANIVSAAGSIEKLATMPACNIQVLGLNRNHLPGMSNLNKFSSFLSFSSFVQNSGPLKKKAEKMLAYKVALAARIDFFSEFPNGCKGSEFLESLIQSLEKHEKVASTIKKKPLPVPKELKKPHRGGKRIRAAKKKYEMTEIRKQVNRVQFGVSETEDFGTTENSFGMLGKMGKTKASKNKHKISQKNKNLLNGTTSCFAFSNQNELKLENPQNIRVSQSKYFDKSAGFTTVISEMNAKTGE